MRPELNTVSSNSLCMSSGSLSLSSTRISIGVSSSKLLGASGAAFGGSFTLVTSTVTWTVSEVFEPSRALTVTVGMGCVS